jgi:hypothetical protein
MKNLFVLGLFLLSACATPFLSVSGKVYEKNMKGLGDMKCAVIKEISLKELTNGESNKPECWCMLSPGVSGEYIITALLLADPSMCKK